MPVDYRAGAAIAHPHSIVELFNDLARGSLSHHDHDAPDARNDYHIETYRPPSTKHAGAPAFVPGAPHSALGASTASVGAASAILHNDASPADQADDAPSLSPWTTIGKFVAFPLALPLTAILLWYGIGTTRAWFQEGAWAGRTPAPELPPPRDCARLFTLSVP